MNPFTKAAPVQESFRPARITVASPKPFIWLPAKSRRIPAPFAPARREASLSLLGLAFAAFHAIIILGVLYPALMVLGQALGR